ncbi:hypothetical protein FNF28_00359 [Cafeteria roenbergensis]|nr:hypothetical protein FNF28_00359 [Cafeteria roenbergensis]
MVGVGASGKTSVLAQVCIVNQRMETIYLSYVKPKERVTDFRTWVSGVEPKHIKNAPSFESVVKAVSDITAGRIVVGHALKNDLHALMLKHPKHLVRDTSKYPPFRRRHGGKSRPRKLRDVSADTLGMLIQTGEHDPVSALVRTRRTCRS